MVKWKIRSPDTFPAAYALAVERAVEQLRFRPDQSEASAILHNGIETTSRVNTLMDKFRLWRRCLREHPLHRLAYLERHYAVRCRAVPESGFDGHQTWAIHVAIRRRENLAEELKHLLEQ